jgi:four helix bundle protein
MDEGRGTKRISSVRELDAYKKSFDTAMEIFEISKKFPKEERYSMTDQVRRSSRAVCANLAEGWRKRNYKAVFINKLTDSSQEAAETQTWLEFALACKYISKEEFDRLDDKYEHIFAMLITMERKADSFVHHPSPIIHRNIENGGAKCIPNY